jgi:hypothetical protein
VNNLNELNKAVAWLEGMITGLNLRIKYNSEPEHILTNYKQQANHCRVLLDALRWIPCAEKKPTDEAVQRAIEFYELNLQSREDDAIEDDVSARLRIVLTALRQMRTEPCEVCSNGECTMVGTDYHCESECAVCRYNLKDKNFCPNCGRPLEGGE